METLPKSLQIGKSMCNHNKHRSGLISCSCIKKKAAIPYIPISSVIFTRWPTQTQRGEMEVRWEDSHCGELNILCIYKSVLLWTCCKLYISVVPNFFKNLAWTRSSTRWTSVPMEFKLDVMLTLLYCITLNIVTIFTVQLHARHSDPRTVDI